jgi:hypothetical protein
VSLEFDGNDTFEVFALRSKDVVDVDA